MTTQTLYRFFNSDDELLYVGITLNLPARITGHRSGQPWWTEVATVTLEHHTSRDDVLAAEKSAIRTERPRYNVIYNHRLLSTVQIVKMVEGGYDPTEDEWLQHLDQCRRDERRLAATGEPEPPLTDDERERVVGAMATPGHWSVR